MNKITQFELICQLFKAVRSEIQLSGANADAKETLNRKLDLIQANFFKEFKQILVLHAEDPEFQDAVLEYMSAPCDHHHHHEKGKVDNFCEYSKHIVNLVLLLNDFGVDLSPIKVTEL